MHCDTTTNRTPEAYRKVAGPDETLSERHRLELEQGSGIPPDVIAERGCFTARHPRQLLDLGFPEWQCRAPALVFPLHGVDGSNGRYAIKPDFPRERDGKAVKYDYPAGSSHMLDVPPRCLPALLDPGAPLMLTEGAKKSDVAAALGYCAVNIWGTSSWYTNPQHGGFATIEPLGDWEPIKPTLDGRICYLAYDSDAWRNANVARELRRLANWLTRQGALVFVVHLPDEPDGSKNGLDDFVVRHGAAAFADLVADAEPWGSVGMVRKLEAEIRDLKQQLSAQAAVLRNSELSATQKVVAIATVHEAGWAVSAGKSTPFKVNYGVLARAAGVSSQSVSSAIKVLSAPSGLFVQHHTREETEDGQWRSVVRLEPRSEGGVVALLRATAEYKPPDRPAWGGKRTPRCPDHPLADLAKRSTLTCVECGQVVGDPVITILKSQDDISDEPGDNVDGLDDRADLLNGQDDISEVTTPYPGTGVVTPTPGTTGGQDDISERCSECARPLYPGSIERGVCDPCARALVAM